MAQVKLRVKETYKSWEMFWQAGEVIEVPEELASWLQRDAPMAFEELGSGELEIGSSEEERSVDMPPVDKMVKRASSAKALRKK